jgi:hypothetical protein
MLARLGIAIYWLCCLFAALIAALGVAAWYDRFSAASNGPAVMLVFAAAAAIVWGIGRAVRYVLAGT